MLYLISYDLKERETGKDYTPLYDAIKSCSSQWWHYLESVWIIKTTHSIEECNSIIKNQIGENDYLLLFDITSMSYQGWLPSKAWEWISNNING